MFYDEKVEFEKEFFDFADIVKKVRNPFHKIVEGGQVCIPLRMENEISQQPIYF